MIFSNPKSLGIALGMGFLTSIIMLPQANAESAFEPTAPVPAAEVEAPAVQQQPVYQQPMLQQQVLPQPVVIQQPMAPQPVYIQAPVAAPQARVLQPLATESDDVANMSKSELVRRERLRRELQNEDMLQERLEELRLRDERRRTDELIAGQPIGAQTTAAQVGMIEPIAPIPAPATTVAMNTVAVGDKAFAQDQAILGQSMMMTANVTNESPDADVTKVYFQPKVGLTNFKEVGFYDVRAKYSAGMGLGLSVSDNLSFELGYTFSEYGVAMNSNNPFAIEAQYRANMNGITSTAFEAVTMKQNIVDAGLKVHMLGPSAKLRPFISGGGAYSKSFINANQQVIDQMNQSGIASPDYDLVQFLGYVSTGFDIRVNKSISIDLTGKYYSVLSSRQNGLLNNTMGGYYGNGGYYNDPYAYSSGYGVSASDADKQEISNAFAKTSFYSITGGVNFSF